MIDMNGLLSHSIVVDNLFNYKFHKEPVKPTASAHTDVGSKQERVRVVHHQKTIGLTARQKRSVNIELSDVNLTPYSLVLHDKNDDGSSSPIAEFAHFTGYRSRVRTLKEQYDEEHSWLLFEYKSALYYINLRDHALDEARLAALMALLKSKDCPHGFTTQHEISKIQPSKFQKIGALALFAIPQLGLISSLASYHLILCLLISSLAVPLFLYAFHHGLETWRHQETHRGVRPFNEDKKAIDKYTATLFMQTFAAALLVAVFIQSPLKYSTVFNGPIRMMMGNWSTGIVSHLPLEVHLGFMLISSLTIGIVVGIIGAVRNHNDPHYRFSHYARMVGFGMLLGICAYAVTLIPHLETANGQSLLNILQGAVLFVFTMGISHVAGSTKPVLVVDVPPPLFDGVDDQSAAKPLLKGERKFEPTAVIAPLISSSIYTPVRSTSYVVPDQGLKRRHSFS